VEDIVGCTRLEVEAESSTGGGVERTGNGTTMETLGAML